MTRKDTPLVDPTTAESASTRRSLIGAVGAAGVVGAAAALIGSSSASGAPNRPTDADRAGLAAAMQLELAARDLFRDAARALDGRASDTAAVVAENHEAYAQAIAGTIGRSANTRNDGVYSALAAAFGTSDDQAFAAAARDLENTAVATHSALLGAYDSIDAIELTASIVTVEARHAAVFTSMAGFAANLDDMLGPDAAALDLTGGAA